jgi:hypothetical protein
MKTLDNFLLNIFEIVSVFPTLFRAAKVKTSYQFHNSNLDLFLLDDCFENM